MLIDIRKRKFGFEQYYLPVKDIVSNMSAIDILLSQRPSRGGLPPSMLNVYLDKTTPLDVKMQFENLMTSLSPQHSCSTEEDAFASVIPRNCSVQDLEQIIEDSQNVIKEYNNSNDDG